MKNKSKRLPALMLSFLFIFLQSGYALEMVDFPISAFTSIIPMGDVDGNFLIDIVDALLIAQDYVGLVQLKQEASGDTDLDGDVTIVDALRVAQYYVGIILKTVTPEINPGGGWYSSGRSITITCNNQDAEIYYTQNGSFPGAGSPVYTSPFLLNQTTTVKAVAMKQGNMASNILAVNYSLSDNIIKKGSWECPYFINTDKRHLYYAIKDSYLYVCTHYTFTDMPPDNIRIFDLSDHMNVKEAGFIELDYSIEGIFINGDYAYIPDYGEYIHIFDISDPVTPRFVSTIGHDGNNIKFNSHYGYVKYANTITIVDIQNPAVPQIINTFEASGTFTDYEIHGDYIYFAMGSEGIQVMDIKDKQNPFIAMEYTWPDREYVSHAEVMENYLFLAVYGTLVVMDITDPADPVQIAQEDLPFDKPEGAVTGFVLENNVIALGSGYEHCFAMFDVSDPASPRLMYHYLTNNVVRRVFSDNNNVYIWEGYNCIKIYDITDLQQPFMKACIDTQLSLKDVFVKGNYTYTYDVEEGIKIFDVSDPSAPLFISQVYDRGSIIDLFVREDFLYFLSSENLVIMDVSNPSLPGKLSNLQLPTGTQSIYLKGNYAYLANYYDGLIIVDVRNPDQPELVSQTETNHIARAVYVLDEENAFISDTEARLLRMDISDPANPVKLNHFGYHNKFQLFGYGNYLFSSYIRYGEFTETGIDEYGLEITDVSDPENPLSLSIIQYPSQLADIFVAGDYAIGTCRNEQVELLDISNPGTPLQSGMLDDSENAYGVFVSGKYIYITKDESPESLVIYEIQ